MSTILAGRSIDGLGANSPAISQIGTSTISSATSAPSKLRRKRERGLSITTHESDVDPTIFQVRASDTPSPPSSPSKLRRKRERSTSVTTREVNVDPVIPLVRASDVPSTSPTRAKIRRKRARVISVTTEKSGEIWVPAPAPPPPPPPLSLLLPYASVSPPPKPDYPVQECTVCRNDIVAPPFQPPTSACTHPGEMCLQCIIRFIEERITSGRDLEKIICPRPACLKVLTYQDIWKWTRESKATDMLERYETALTRVTLARDPAFRWCMNPKCQVGQIHDGGADKALITCHGCGSKQCFRHQIPWHENRNCSQWEEYLSQLGRTDVSSHKLIIQTSKRCPHAKCGVRITRISGCDSMYCTKPLGCGQPFCWQCLAPFNRHYDSCTHYSGRAGGNPAPPIRPEPLPEPPLVNANRSWLQRLATSWFGKVTMANRNRASDGADIC